MNKLLIRFFDIIRSRSRSLSTMDNILTQQYFSFFENQNQRRQKKVFRINELTDCRGIISNCLAAENHSALHNIHLLFPHATFRDQQSDISDAAEYTVWGHLHSKNLFVHSMLANALERGKCVYIFEDAFFKSATTWADTTKPLRYRAGISFTIDDLACYYDSVYPSRLEMKLNSRDELTADESMRSRKTIDFIIESRITKYNHQPIYRPEIGRKGAPKVLVIDQSYNDYSIVRCQANDSTFKNMLDAAVYENPDADIIIKTHPDTIANKSERTGYYVKMQEQERIFLQRSAINPICLLKEVDKVYVCSSQMGFEALMAGCQVVTFGIPFYAGWGMTDDRHPLLLTKELKTRRSRNRSLEEIFYFAYIWYSHYVNPISGSTCEIEDALQHLIDLRKEYFEKYNVLMRA